MGGNKKYMITLTSILMEVAKDMGETIQGLIAKIANILMEVAKDMGESQTATNFEFQDYAMALIALVSIIVTGFIACYNAKKNKEITKMTLDATSQNLITQMHQIEIKESIKKLSELVRTGNVTRIQDLMDSAEGIYIPPSLKKEIKENLNEEFLDIDKVNVILDLINKYISP
jgi:hypothetical protein